MLGSHVSHGNVLRFRYHYQGAPSLAVAGSFSGWQPLGMTPLGEGWWGLDVEAPAGGVHYKFVTPSGWELDQYNYRRSQDGQNSFLDVAGDRGHLLKRWFHSPSLAKNKEYMVYFPPEYSRDPGRSFPYLVLMGGLFEGASGWVDRAAIHEKLDAMIAGGHIPPMVVVMPDKDDAVFHKEAFEAYFRFLSQDVVGHIDSEYRVLPVRGVEGLSLGGIWALRLGAVFPDRFCSVASMSGLVETDMFELARQRVAEMRQHELRVRLSCGDGEGECIGNNQSFKDFLVSQGVYSEFHVNPGIHRWSLWEGQIAHSLAFHGYGFRRRL